MKFLNVFIAICIISLFASCTSKFNEENWEGACFMSDIAYTGNDFENDSAKIVLLQNGICKVENLSFVEFSDSIKWPDKFTGNWELYQIGENKYLRISYQHKSTSFNVESAYWCGNRSAKESALHYYVGDPDDYIFHYLTFDSKRSKIRGGH